MIVPAVGRQAGAVVGVQRTRQRARRAGSVQLRGLLPVERRVALVGFAVAGATAVVVLAVSSGTGLPSGNAELTWPFTPWVVEVALAGLAVTAGLLTLAALADEWRGRRGLLVFVGIGGALAALVSGGGLVGSVGLRVAPSVAVPLLWAVHVLVWVGVVAGLFVAIAPLRWARRRRAVTAPAAAMPFVAAMVAFPAAGWLAPRLGAAVDGWVSGGLQALALPAMLVTAAVSLGMVGAVIRITRDATVRVGVGHRAGVGLAALLTLKVVWVVLARVNASTLSLPGIAGAWEASNHEHVVQWAVATVLVAGFFVLLVHADALALSERPLPSAALLATGIFLTPMAVLVMPGVVGLAAAQVGTDGDAVAVGVAAAAAAVLASWPYRRSAWVIAAAAVLIAVSVSLQPTRLLSTPADIISTLYRFVAWWPGVQAMAVSVILIGGLGSALVRHRATRSGGVFLLLFAVWSLPKVLDILSPAGWATLTPGLLTFDTVVTVAVGVCALGWWRGQQRLIAPEMLLLTLVVVTVGTHGVALFPESMQTSLFGVFVVVPVAYLLLIEARGMTGDPGTHAGRALAVTGYSCGMLALSALLMDAGNMGPETVAVLDLAPFVFVIPLAAFLLATTRIVDVTPSRSGPVADPPRRAAATGSLLSDPDHRLADPLGPSPG